jgi:uncharacterized membrane protein
MADDAAAKAASQQEPVVVVAGAVADDQGVLAEGAVAAQGDHAIVVARFADMQAATAVYDSLRSGEAGGAYHIDGVLVVNADGSGKVHVQKMTDHHTRNGLAWGAVAGVVLGVIFPPTIIGSAVALGAAGAVVGKVGNQLQKGKVADAVKDVITPGTSGILALVQLADAPAVEKAMPQATAVQSVPVDAETTQAVKEAAAAAGSATGAGTPAAPSA